MSNPDAITTSEVHWNYCAPPSASKKVLLLTTGKVATIGIWGNGKGVIAWTPLPKRDKQLEKDKGL